MKRCKIIRVNNPENDMTSYIQDGWEIVQIAACSDKSCWVLMKRGY